MLKIYSKHIFCAVLCCLLGLFLPDARVMAQSDSGSGLNEVSPDEPVTTDEDEPAETDTEQYYFIRKENRAKAWAPFDQKNIPDSVARSLKKEDAFWYADIAEHRQQKIKNNNQRSPSGISPWLRLLIWIVIIAGFVTFLIIYLTGSNVGLFRKRNVVIDEREDDTMPEDIFVINYPKEIAKATAAGNFRLAVRLLFLQLLKNMSERDIINYKQDKTNFDYLSELADTGWYPSFFKVTRNYEYSWYGQFEISDETYRLIRKDFDQFEHQLSRNY